MCDSLVIKIPESVLFIKPLTFCIISRGNTVFKSPVSNLLHLSQSSESLRGCDWPFFPLSQWQKWHDAKKGKILNRRIQLISELHDFSLPPTLTQRGPALFYHSPPINILPLPSSIWLRGMRKFRVIASANQRHYNQSGWCVSCNYQPLLTHQTPPVNLFLL